MRISALRILFVLIAVLAAGTVRSESDRGTVNIGFFEGGSFPAHAEIRKQFRSQLESMLPSEMQAVYVPQGFKSANWNRDTCRQMAFELAADSSIDMVVAFGPWTVEDLLEAGFKRPIVAAYRFDPELEGLLDSAGRPIAPNLTVRSRPGKIRSDLVNLKQLTDAGRVAFLHFPSGDESDRVFDEVARIGQELDMEMVTAEGYDRDGAYAYFKAFGRLEPKPEALYLGPLWGLDASMMRQFYEMVGRDNIPAFSSEGEFQALRGALAAGSGESLRMTARYAAWKASRIIRGETPADLRVSFPEQPGLTVNQMAARHFDIFLDRRWRLSAQFVKITPSIEAETFTLADAVNRALVQNPGYLARYDLLEAAAQAALQARSAYLPQLRAEASAFYHDDNEVSNHPRYDNSRYHAGLTLEQEILSLGAIKDIQLAANNRDLREAELRAATLDLEYALTVAYLNYARATSLRDIRSTHRRIAEECRQIADVREELDEGERADVLRLEDELIQAMAALETADHNLQTARVLFNRLIGRPSEMELALQIGSFDGSLLSKLQDLLNQLAADPDIRSRFREFLIAEALANSPEFEMRGLALSGQEMRLSKNRSDFLPRIGFSASLNLTDEQRDSDVFTEEHLTWSAGAKLELPLLLGTGRFKEREKLRAELSALEYQKDEVYLKIAGQIDIHLSNLTNLCTRLYLAVNSARLAQEYLTITIDRYTAGECDISDLLEAVSNDRRARMAVTVDQADCFRAAAALVRELGWSVHDSGQSPDEMLVARLTPQLQAWLQDR